MLADSEHERKVYGASGAVDLPALSAAITDRLEADGARRNGGELRFPCPAPAHRDDPKPSAEWNARKGMWNCRTRDCHQTHGGGALVLAALLGLDLDPFRGAAAPARRAAAPERRNGSGLAKGTPKGQATPAPAGAAPAPKRPQTLEELRRRKGCTVFEYQGADGQAIGLSIRVNHADGGKHFELWRPDGAGAWLPERIAGQYPPYRLPAILTSSGAVYLAEGEQCADALAAFGLTGTTCIMGAGKAEHTDLTHLQGRAVVILPDNDEAGAAHAKDVADKLQRIGASVRILAPFEPPATFKGKGYDVADWLADGGTASDFEALAKAAPEPAGAAGEKRWQGIPYCPPGEWECDDYGNGGRLVTLYGDRMRWHAARKAWLTFDGRRWADDTRGKVADLVRLTVRSMLHEAAEESDPDRTNALLKWHKASANGGRPGEMLNRARIDLTTPGEAWDADPWALNVANGTLNLRTGELRHHDPADFLTLLAPVEYHAGAHLAGSGPLAASAALWQRFLSDATGGDADLGAFLQRAAGATLAGDTRGTDALFFIFGPGGTGKSSFANALFRILGDYADTVDAGALMKAREATGPRPEIAKLQGKRMAVAFEAEAGRAFNDALVKTLTGGDKISARMLHANPVTFEPQFTFWLVANDKPRADVNDSGFWRRVKTLPFNVKPSGPPDPTLRDRLPLEAGPAILSWAFEGCRAWQAAGLGQPPAAVEDATAEYRASVDPLADWLADRCSLEPTAWTAAGRLYDDYKGWATGAGEPAPLSNKEFGRHMKARVGESSPRTVAGASVRVYRGIGLKVPTPAPRGGADYRTTEVTEESNTSLKNGHRLSELYGTTVTSVVGRSAEPLALLPGEIPA